MPEISVEPIENKTTIDERVDLRTQRFLRAQNLDKIFCSRDLVAIQPHLIKDLCREFDVSVRAEPFVRSVIEREGFEYAFSYLALSKLVGCSPLHMHEYLNRVGAEPRDILNALLKHTESYYSGELGQNVEGLVLRHPERQSERIKLFPAHFRSLDAAVVYRDAHLRASGSEVFAMYLPEADMLEVQQSLGTFGPDHVLDAFGYILYREENQNITVLEIQSDVYGALQSRGLKERYKHWSRQLLSAFLGYLKTERVQPTFSSTSSMLEMAINDLPETHPLRNLPAELADVFDQLNQHLDLLQQLDQRAREPLQLRLFFPTSKTIKERWPNILAADGRLESPGIADSLAQLLYEDLPRFSGLERCPMPSVQFPERSSKGKQIIVNDYWVSGTGVLRDATDGYFSDVVGALLRNGPHINDAGEVAFGSEEIFSISDFHKVALEGSPLAMSADRRYMIDGVDHFHAVDKFFATVPLLQVPPMSFAGVSDPMLQLHPE